MEIIEVIENKKEYLSLLLLADEQENMIDRYLSNGKMYVLDDNGIKCECVITDEGNGVLDRTASATLSEANRFLMILSSTLPNPVSRTARSASMAASRENALAMASTMVSSCS